MDPLGTPTTFLSGMAENIIWGCGKEKNDKRGTKEGKTIRAAWHYRLDGHVARDDAVVGSWGESPWHTH